MIKSTYSPMIKAELQARAKRLIEGRAKPEDLDRLFLDQRESAHGRESFRELGDFLAHRDQRNKGPVTQRVRDVFTSFRVWSLGFQGVQATASDLRAAGVANLNLSTDDELRSCCGLKRDAARQKFDKAMRKLEVGDQPSQSDLALVNYLANRFVWKPAFTDEVLHEDFVQVSLRNQVIELADLSKLVNAKRLLALYAITRLHGAVIKVADGHLATLYAGFSNKERRLEVKVDLATDGWAKPVRAPICMFLTTLCADDYCDPALLEQPNPVMWNSWSQPIELGEDRKLRAIN